MWRNDAAGTQVIQDGVELSNLREHVPRRKNMENWKHSGESPGLGIQSGGEGEKGMNLSR